jgi:hypothetical protein
MNDSPDTSSIDRVAKTSLIRSFFSMLFTPGKAAAQPVGWGLAFTISGLAFGMLFLQTGLDLVRAGKADNNELIKLTLTGIAMGTIGVLIIASLAWAGAKLSGSENDLPFTLRAFGMAYSPALLYGICGLIVNLILHWNTAVAFGITGLLWALSPVAAVIRQLTRDKMVPALLITTLCGAAMMAGWAYFGGVL